MKRDDDDEQGELFGTEPFKLVRPGDPDTSHEAAEAVDTTKLEAMVYQAILSFGPHGCISDQLRHRFYMYPYSSITARYAALIEKKLIYDTGERRPGDSGRNQRVLCATRYRPLAGVRQPVAPVKPRAASRERLHKVV